MKKVIISEQLAHEMFTILIHKSFHETTDVFPTMLKHCYEDDIFEDEKFFGKIFERNSQTWKELSDIERSKIDHEILFWFLSFPNDKKMKIVNRPGNQYLYQLIELYEVLFEKNITPESAL